MAVCCAMRRHPRWLFDSMKTSSSAAPYGRLTKPPSTCSPVEPGRPRLLRSLRFETCSSLCCGILYTSLHWLGLWFLVGFLQFDTAEIRFRNSRYNACCSGGVPGEQCIAKQGNTDMNCPDCNPDQNRGDRGWSLIYVTCPIHGRFRSGSPNPPSGEQPALSPDDNPDDWPLRPRSVNLPTTIS